MQKFNKTVPFDPGYKVLSFPFMGSVDMLNQQFSALKANHQKKFWLIKNEYKIVDFIRKNTAIYLGCMLWGAFLAYRFKKNPIEIVGNNTVGLSKEALQNLDCASEVKFALEYIKLLERDMKYYVGKSFKIDNIIPEILENYIEFNEINDNFKEIKFTNQVLLPKRFEHFSNFSENDLDILCEKIFDAISHVSHEDILNLKFYDLK